MEWQSERNQAIDMTFVSAQAEREFGDSDFTGGAAVKSEGIAELAGGGGPSHLSSPFSQARAPGLARNRYQK